MCNYEFIKADKNLFAVYQTVYSQADVEMWFSWDDRLNDTKWSDGCFFLCRDGEKVGGVIISDGLVMYAFLVPPFCDRYLFWRLVIKKTKELTTKSEIAFNGVLENDVRVLQNLGAQVWRPRQMMCRPTDVLPYVLPDGVFIETPAEKDIPEIADVQHRSFLNSISYKMFGEDNIENIIDGIKKDFEQYTETDTLKQFIVARLKADNQIIGACMAGINPKTPNLFAGIGNVFVLPKYRGRGVGEALIKHSITAAYPKTPVMKLHVLAENASASLYHKLGFISGPVFTDMKYML